MSVVFIQQLATTHNTVITSVGELRYNIHQHNKNILHLVINFSLKFIIRIYYGLYHVWRN